ncbi:MAG: hypothetical protein M1836_000304 [Candelina mexicana]|nr:MAG: hypothetical protein M1836_000304 [Candelina mexicana]
MGRNRDAVLDAAFIEFKSQPDDKCVSIRCRYCNWTRAKNSIRQRHHLQDCGAYQLSTGVESFSTSSGITPRAQREMLASNKPVIFYRPVASVEEKESLDHKAAMAIYAGKLPYNFFDEPDMAAALQMLNPSYQPPSPDELRKMVSDIAQGITKPSNQDARPAKRQCLVQSRLRHGRDESGAEKLDLYKGHI